VFAVPDGHKDVRYLEASFAKRRSLHCILFLHAAYLLENAQVGCNSVKQIFCSGEALDKNLSMITKQVSPTLCYITYMVHRGSDRCNGV